ncbi:MAG: presenilin family intramembrane aspartyl protease [Candidatus Pacearchaeota archaeon]
MKHQLRIALLLIVLFVLAQLAGLAVTASYKKHFETEKISTEIKEAKELEKNVSEERNVSVIKEVIPEKIEIKRSVDIISLIASFFVALIMATVIFILLMKIGVVRFMRFWFFLVVFIGLFISFSLLLIDFIIAKVKIGSLYFSVAEIVAFFLAILLAFYKIYRNEVLVHNLTEIFIYPGIVTLFLPIVNLPIVIGLLLIISIYDFVAVFRTKHMQKMAKFMLKDVKVFSGLMLPYISKKEKERLERIRLKRKRKARELKIKVNLAVLGGGDIAFPMLLSAEALLSYGLLSSAFVIAFSTLALFFLLALGEKGKAYPAMPPLSVGGLIGFSLSLLFI